MRLDQYLPDFAPRDAIGNHVLQVRQALRDTGVDSDIYADVVHDGLEGEAAPYTSAPDAMRPDGLVLYHASTQSEMAAWLAERAGAGQRTLVYYHNITPARYFEQWLPEVAGRAAAARTELAALAPYAELAMGASHFNEAELVDLGFPVTATCPLLVDLDAYQERPDERVLGDLRQRRAAGGTDWLFVGRIVPNKCQHDVVAAFAVYRRLFDPAARLTLVGAATAPDYKGALRDLATELDVWDAVEILAGVPHPEMLARFSLADVMVCLSEHEGFCVPLLEAMALGVPVVAYAAAAVPETVGDAGVLLEGKDPLEVAGAVADLLADPPRRDALVAAGRRRAGGFDLDHSRARLLEVLEPYLGGGAPER